MKNCNGSYFSIGSSCQPCLVQTDFYWLHDMVACCYFGVDLGNGLDRNSLSLLTKGTPHSSSDLLYFTLLLPFTSTHYSKSNSILLFCLLDKYFLSPNFSSPFSLDKKILSPTSILQKYSETIPNSVLVAKSFQFYKNILCLIFFLT